MLATAPALFPVEIAGQIDLFDQAAQEETTVTETPAPAPRDHMDGEYTYVAVLSDGRTVTRTAPGRAFTHMLESEFNDGTPGVFEVTWCESLIDAERAAENVHATWTYADTVRILPTVGYPYNSAEAQAARRRAGDCGTVAQQQELADPTVPVPAPTVPVATSAPAPRKASTRRGPNPHHRTFVATLSDGSTVTRSSKTTDYSHITECTRRDGGRPGVWQWHKSVQAAQKTADQLRGRGYANVRVRTVTGRQYNSAAAKIARATEKAEQAS